MAGFDILFWVLAGIVGIVVIVALALIFLYNAFV